MGIYYAPVLMSTSERFFDFFILNFMYISIYFTYYRLSTTSHITIQVSERENFARQSAHTARVGATCPTTARAMIAMVEEGSFITADFSGELQGFRSFPSVGQVCHKVFNCSNMLLHHNLQVHYFLPTKVRMSF